ncbi:MAG: hypothetical protein JWP29_3492 [Rhodoferax sp.]|nr:hypothetical protein [Rhodoferax sp.]
MPLLTMAQPTRLPVEANWILGTWRSDVDRSMANFIFQGRRPSEDMRVRIAALFGKMTHTFTPTSFIAEEALVPRSLRSEMDYRVERCTSDSVSVVFAAPRINPGFTLYRGDGCYFVISAAKNLEYFKKVPV